MLVSVVIPAYNRAALLPETLSSVREQTFTDWECIVVDDGSTDHTREVVLAACAEDRRVRYIHQENAERSAARNTGIRHSRGEYICFLDSDDRYTPRYLQRLTEFLFDRGFPEALVISGFQLWDGVRLREIELPPIGGNPAAWLFEHPVSPSRACVHSEITKRFRFREDIRIVEDSVLWVSVATMFPVLLLPEPLIWYRVHDGNSVDRSTRAAFDRHDGLLKFFADPRSNDVPRALRRDLLSDVRFRMAESHAHQGQKGKALCAILWSIFSSPFHRHTKAKLFFIMEQFPGILKMWRFLKPMRTE